MVFSMFLRNSVPACRRLLRQQAMQLSAQKPLQLRMVCSALPVTTRILEGNSTPILNAVRSFRTSPVSRASDVPHDHARLWVIEKATAALLVVLIPAGLMMPNKIIDSVLAILITAHSFWGLEAMVVEYVRVLLFGHFIPKLAMALVYCIEIVILGGLFYLIFNDVGLCRAFWKIWQNMKKPDGSRKTVDGRYPVAPCPPKPPVC